MFSHAWGGGVERHVRDLLALLKPHVDVLVLRGFLDGGVELEWHAVESPATSVRIGGFGKESIDAWIGALRDLEFSRIHIHHLHGWPIEVLRLVEALELPIDVTLHDYFYPCPQYHLVDENNRYCGEPDIEGCRACVAKRPHAWGLQIDEWRETMGSLLSRAARVFAPTHDVAERTKKYFPTITPIVLAHYESEIEIPRIVKVAVLGGLSAIKGLKTVGDTAREAQVRRLPIAIRVIGHASEPLPDGVTASGTYEDADLPRLLAIERPDVIWFPAQVPETFSYTLSVAIASGLPIVATDFASFRERLSTHSKKIFVSIGAAPGEWLSAFQNFASLSTSLQARTSIVNKPNPASTSYAERYLGAFDKLAIGSHLGAGACERFLTLVGGSPAAPSLPDHPLFTLFRIGIHGGHRQSLDAVEQQLASIPEHERQIVGRSVFESAASAQRQYKEAYESVFDAYQREREARRVTLDRCTNLEQQASANAQQISQLQNELGAVLSSRSWRYTRPLRSLVFWVRKLRHT
jgi:O-antigen biosynthesis protein